MFLRLSQDFGLTGDARFVRTNVKLGGETYVRNEDFKVTATLGGRRAELCRVAVQAGSRIVFSLGLACFAVLRPAVWVLAKSTRATRSMTRLAVNTTRLRGLRRNFQSACLKNMALSSALSLMRAPLWGLESTHVGSGANQAPANTILYDELHPAGSGGCINLLEHARSARCALTSPMRLKQQTMTLSRILISPSRRLSDGRLRQVAPILFTVA